MSYYKKLSFTQKILAAMLFGAILGIILNNISVYNSLINQYLSNGVFEVVGKLFVNSLKMLVVPLVFCSITVGITSLGNLSLMGRVGLKAIIIYLLKRLAIQLWKMFPFVSLLIAGAGWRKFLLL